MIDAGALGAGARTALVTEDQTDVERRAAKELHAKLGSTMLNLLPKLYLLKSDAFIEEQEWRLLSHCSLTGEESAQYHPRLDRLSPFRTYKLLEPKYQAIVEVVLGPKHLTPEASISGFMATEGFGDVAVRRSRASYR